jgi:hypothetical protein
VRGPNHNTSFLGGLAKLPACLARYQLVHAAEFDATYRCKLCGTPLEYSIEDSTEDLERKAAHDCAQLLKNANVAISKQLQDLRKELRGAYATIVKLQRAPKNANKAP